MFEILGHSQKMIRCSLVLSENTMHKEIDSFNFNVSQTATLESWWSCSVTAINCARTVPYQISWRTSYNTRSGTSPLKNDWNEVRWITVKRSLFILSDVATDYHQSRVRTNYPFLQVHSSWKLLLLVRSIDSRCAEIVRLRSDYSASRWLISIRLVVFEVVNSWCDS